MRDIPAGMRIDVQNIEQDALLVLYEVDLSYIGGDLYRFHSGLNGLRQSVVWQGNTYQPYPVEASGFEANGKGTSNRPTLTLANISGLITGINQDFDDAVGAIVTRREVYEQYLDAENFDNGNPQADPTMESVNRYEIEQCTAQQAEFVTYTLCLPCETDGALLPARTILADVCQWVYRSADCGYTGGPVADEFDQPTSDGTKDKCGKRLGSCKLRFGATSPLNTSAFPAANKIK
ncbi:Minor tail protein L [Sodalis praecaptivus]|uniref:Minor tail protein L n=1 Tax=Sodalis praecaptivus TaxID=1239307 RepID=W0HZF1_9GAMM|nr:phage minor tail protein L [Sodalis praecaptivus]AHF77897.1 Minor tail protein L [Sodalis praecaptivus]